MPLPSPLPFNLANNTILVKNGRSTKVSRGTAMVLAITQAGSAVWMSPNDTLPGEQILSIGIPAEDILPGGVGSVFALNGVAIVATPPNTPVPQGSLLAPTGPSFLWAASPPPDVGAGPQLPVTYALTAGASLPLGDEVLAFIIEIPNANSQIRAAADNNTPPTSDALVKVGPLGITPLTALDFDVSTPFYGVAKNVSNGLPVTCDVVFPGCITSVVWDGVGAVPTPGDPLSPSTSNNFGMVTKATPSAAFPLRLLVGLTIRSPVGPSPQMSAFILRSSI